MNDNKKNDEAVSSVVGEMIMITLVVMLAALFATSAFSLVPGSREPSVDVAMVVNETGDKVLFWHKGGDWVEGKDLTVIVINEDGRKGEYRKGDKDNFVLYGYNDTVGGCVFDDSGKSEAFDLGGCLNVTLKSELKTGDIVRLVTPKTVIYSGEIKC